MTTTAPTPTSRAAGPRPARSIRLLQAVGWTLIGGGVVVLLYLVYSLFFTNLETNAAQAEMLVEFEELIAAGPQQSSADGSEGAQEPDEVGSLPDAEEGGSPPDAAEDGSPPDADDDGVVPETDAAPTREPPELGSAVAMIEFDRPGSDARPVRDDPLLVVSGVSREHLKRGPGHYPNSAEPGADGNFAVAGHRTTYGAPFFDLDELEPDDEVHVTDRSGQRHVYRVLEQRIVTPSDHWVLAPDPLGRDAGLLTLTTCHPRFSARQRLIVFAELVT